jgi:hypothetical protein
MGSTGQPWQFFFKFYKQIFDRLMQDGTESKETRY